MRKKIAIIDPFIKTPALGCANELMEHFPLTWSYHQPSLMGLATLANNKFDAYIILGSASHVTTPLNWHQELSDYLIEKLSQQRPVLGLCFGHQLLAHALGGKVDFYQNQETKISGTRKIQLIRDHLRFKKDMCFELIVSHRQIVFDPGTELKPLGVGLNNDILFHPHLPLITTQAHPEASWAFNLGEKVDLDMNKFQKAQQSGRSFITLFLESYSLI